jgi:hypothetical protein
MQCCFFHSIEDILVAGAKTEQWGGPLRESGTARKHGQPIVDRSLIDLFRRINGEPGRSDVNRGRNGAATCSVVQKLYKVMLNGSGPRLNKARG